FLEVVGALAAHVEPLGKRAVASAWLCGEPALSDEFRASSAVVPSTRGTDPMRVWKRARMSASSGSIHPQKPPRRDMRLLALTTTILCVNFTGAAFAQHNSSAWANAVHNDWNAKIEADPTLLYNPNAIFVKFDADKSESYRASVRALVGDGWLEKYTIIPN